MFGLLCGAVSAHLSDVEALTTLFINCCVSRSCLRAMYCLEASNGFRRAGICAYSSVDHLGSYSSRDSSGQLWSLYLACEWISCRAKCYCRIADCVLPDKRLCYYGDRVLSNPPRWLWAEAFIVHAYCTLVYIMTQIAWFLTAFSMSLHHGLLGFRLLLLLHSLRPVLVRLLLCLLTRLARRLWGDSNYMCCFRLFRFVCVLLCTRGGLV